MKLLFLIQLFYVLGLRAASSDKLCKVFNNVTSSSSSDCFKDKEFVKPNFAFLYIDDLRYMLDSDPCYKTAMPNLGKLLKKGIHFENAATSKPLCTPSRVSFLTGRRVGQLQSTDYRGDFKEDFETIPGILHKRGNIIFLGLAYFLNCILRI